MATIEMWTEMWSIKYMTGWLAVITSNLPSPSRLPQQNFACYETENERIAAGWIFTSLDKFSAMYSSMYV